MINRLCRIGHVFSDLDHFVQHDTYDAAAVGDTEFTAVETYKTNPLYRQALRTGIDVQLQKYRQLLLAIELKVLQHPGTPMSYLHQSLAEVCGPYLGNEPQFAHLCLATVY